MTLFVFTGRQSPRETDSFLIPRLRQAVYVRTSRIGRIQQSSYFIEGFPGGIIQGTAKFGNIASQIAHQHQIRVSTRANQPNKRRIKLPFYQGIYRQVSDYVVYAVQRFI